jgi:hypothetical protein
MPVYLRAPELADSVIELKDLTFDQAQTVVAQLKRVGAVVTGTPRDSALADQAVVMVDFGRLPVVILITEHPGPDTPTFVATLDLPPQGA